MAITVRRRQRDGEVKVIKVKGRRGKETEVTVQHRMVPPGWKPWSHEDFSREWSKTFLINKREKNLK